jgi:MFS family permease
MFEVRVGAANGPVLATFSNKLAADKFAEKQRLTDAGRGRRNCDRADTDYLGIISGLTAFVWGEWSFYGIRFLLGLAEAGFYPGIILYLTWWFPSYYRTRIIGIFMTAIPISIILGSIVSNQLLLLDGWLGLQGWQWLFILEAIPAGHSRRPQAASSRTVNRGTGGSELNAGVLDSVSTGRGAI